MPIMAAAPQAPAKTGLAFARCICFVFLVITMVTAGKLSLVRADGPCPSSTLVVYVHEDAAPPNATAITVVPAPGSSNASSTFAFGAIAVIANVLKEGEADDSAVLGQVTGQVTVEKDLSLYLSTTYVLNTPSYKGTLSVQGTTGDILGNGEVAITGGTGDFRFTRGVAVLSFTGKGDPRDTIYKVTLYVKY